MIFAGLIVALAELGGDNAQIVLGMPKVVTGVFKGVLLLSLMLLLLPKHHEPPCAIDVALALRYQSIAPYMHAVAAAGPSGLALLALRRPVRHRPGCRRAIWARHRSPRHWEIK